MNTEIKAYHNGLTTTVLECKDGIVMQLMNVNLKGEANLFIWFTMFINGKWCLVAKQFI